MISVVIPLYNKAHTIVNTLQTVLNQTFKDFEVIIINDGSTDNGVEVINKHFNDSRIKIINQDNQGVSAARNRGVEESISDWVAFLDADDEWHPEYLEYVFKAISSYSEAGMICTGGIVGDIRNRYTVYYRLANKYIDKIVSVDYFENPGVFGHTSATVVRKDIFGYAGKFPLGMKRSQDLACFYSVALISKVVYIGLPLSRYNGGVEAQTTSLKNESVIKHIVNYYNWVMRNYQKTNMVNKTFLIFIKYNIRHLIKNCVTRKDWDSIDYFYNNLDDNILSLFFPFEKVLYCDKNRYALAVLWINITKIIWRLHRFPIVGKRIDTKKIPSKYCIW